MAKKPATVRRGGAPKTKTTTTRQVTKASPKASPPRQTVTKRPATRKR